VNANNDAATYADCAAGSGADTIVLPANENLMLRAVYCSMYGQSCRAVGVPPITSQITIEGNGAIIARQGTAPAFGLMIVRNSGDLTLQNLILRGGSSFGAVSSNRSTVSIKNSIISGNTGTGVSNNYGTLTIANSAILGNTGGGVTSNY